MGNYVTFETAVKLKEKKFDMCCESFYALEDFTAECIDACGDYYEVDFEQGELYLNYPLHYSKHKKKTLSAPNISDVLKWLYMSYRIIISVEPIVNRYSISVSIYSINEDDYEPVWNLVHMIFYDNNNEIYDPIRGLEIGIDYVLDNLI